MGKTIGDYELIDEIARDLGAAARQLRPDLVYSILLSNPDMGDGVALFEALQHLNAFTGRPLNVDNFGLALNNMMLQTEKGRTLNIVATHLIVPTALRWMARKINNSGETRGDDADNGDDTDWYEVPAP